jgi:hypothetical protein
MDPVVEPLVGAVVGDPLPLRLSALQGADRDRHRVRRAEPDAVQVLGRGVRVRVDLAVRQEAQIRLVVVARDLELLPGVVLDDEIAVAPLRRDLEPIDVGAHAAHLRLVVLGGRLIGAPRQRRGEKRQQRDGGRESG